MKKSLPQKYRHTVAISMHFQIIDSCLQPIYYTRFSIFMSNVYVTMNIPRRKIWCHISTKFIMFRFMRFEYCTKLGRNQRKKKFLFNNLGNEFMCSYKELASRTEFGLKRERKAKKNWF